MRSDMDIQKDIVAELKWDPSLRDDDVAVSVRDGVVTLAGFVDSFSDKWKAERIAGQVKGVKAIANDVEVRLPSSSEPQVERQRARRPHQGEGQQRMGHPRRRRGLVLPEGGGGKRRP